jgi:hypothetical protein
MARDWAATGARMPTYDLERIVACQPSRRQRCSASRRAASTVSPPAFSQSTAAGRFGSSGNLRRCCYCLAVRNQLIQEQRCVNLQSRMNARRRSNARKRIGGTRPNLYLSAALSVVGVVAGATDAIHPAFAPPLLGILWALAGGAGIRGISLLRWWPRWVRFAAGATVGCMGYAMWMATTPHAAIRFTNIEVAPANEEAGVLAVRFSMRNDGEWGASTVTLLRTALTDPNVFNDLARRKNVEDHLFEGIEAAYDAVDARDHSVNVPAKTDFYSEIHRVRVTEQQRVAFYNEQLVLLVGRQIRYRDWCLWTHVMSHCHFVSGADKIVVCSRYNY